MCVAALEAALADGQVACLLAELEQLLHLHLLNRGLMITPFHNMMLVCLETTRADVDRLLAAFDAFIGEGR